MGKDDIEKDAQPQYVKSRQGETNTGLTSASPRVEGGSGDATFEAAVDRGSRDGENLRQTGARKFPGRASTEKDAPDLVARTGEHRVEDGLTESQDASPEKTRQSDGRSS